MIPIEQHIKWLNFFFQSMGLEREVGAGQCSDNRASIPRPGLFTCIATQTEKNS